MLDYGALPPEVHSARMYSGSGSASMTSAASAWNMLAAELDSAAADYERIIDQLSSEAWLGPASAHMAEAAKPYVAWMRTTAAQAEQAARSALAATGAYEAAFAATVPPALVDANRIQLTQAMSTNVLGQNTPLITQLEAQYAEMWAQDSAAMYGYAGQAAPAAEVTPFTRPMQTTNPVGESAQAGAVAQAAGNGASTESAQSKLLSAVPRALQALASPAAEAEVPEVPDAPAVPDISDILEENEAVELWAEYAGPAQNTIATIYRATGMSTHFLTLGKSFAPAAAKAAEGAAAAAAGAAAGAGSGVGGMLGGGALAAGLGSAAPIGGLSVPPSWTAAAGPAIAAGTTELPINHPIVTPETGAGAGNLLGGMPLAGMGGGVGGAAPKYGFRPTVMMRPPFAG